ncbi:MAG TPA: TlyA family RNA methyltransferase, partial [Negativicutes bacterium]|nr:TlyA family RNA methyltransferase [Negativicutes bacterium]
MEEKERLDVLIYKQGLSGSREKASSQIMSGIVYVNGVKMDKPGTKVSADSKIEIRGTTMPYVSRGGLKLEKALKEFGLTLAEKVAMDIGASTGGFTDCMLQNGASKVYAIDVGYGQLAWSLRTDSRVICMERTNIRYVTPEAIGERVDFASVDVSFISLTKVLPAAKQLLKDDGVLVCLIKPQFEAGREKVGKKGVVRDKSVHHEVIERIIAFAREEMEFSILGLSYSPIKGPEGNIEYLLYLSCEKDHEGLFDDKDI